ncbi:hypothetical protein [Niallia circulans]|uniref:Uncharacterized protein n=1 Tax=Niallia circulans TaxID=1397 RepID=A0A941G8R4_NIACI|nr:hypothetical protein [Niallia circulans]MCB5235484.1 hypothetical protein [Niallia circulans]
MSTSIFATVCLTCNGTGTIYAGILNGQHKYRTCPRCKGAGEYVLKEQQRKSKEDKGRTGPEVKAYCPKCKETITTRQHFKATKYTTFTCKCGCVWRMTVEDAKVN